MDENWPLELTFDGFISVKLPSSSILELSSTHWLEGEAVKGAIAKKIHHVP